MVLEKNGHHMQIYKSRNRPFFTKVNSKWVRVPNIKQKALKLIGNIRRNLDDFGYGDYF